MFVSALACVLQEAAREWMDWMAGHKPANSGSGKKLWRQYNEEQLQKVRDTGSTKPSAPANPCALSDQTHRIGYKRQCQTNCLWAVTGWLLAVTNL
jgi:hypothetical protein